MVTTVATPTYAANTITCVLMMDNGMARRGSRTCKNVDFLLNFPFLCQADETETGVTDIAQSVVKLKWHIDRSTNVSWGSKIHGGQYIRASGITLL